MLSRTLRRAMSIATRPTLETLQITDIAEHVVQVQLNRPDKSNAFNRKMWSEIRIAFEALARVEDPCRAVVLTAAGKNFTAGLDLMDHVGLLSDTASDPARRAWVLRDMIVAYQEAISAVEACPKPVIAAVHAACVGAGVDLVSAADIRLASSDAFFSIKEVDVGLAADVGTLQRLPKIIGNDSIARELAFTGRRWLAEEALAHGFLSRVLATREALLVSATTLAVEIAGKSPVAVQGTKLNLNYSRDHTVQEGLEWGKLWNMSMLQVRGAPSHVH
jgi:delta(3,5)-delta(2,4)-dienoyl-CoA isomerase